MSGSYMGKDWSAIGTLLDIHKIDDKKTVVFFLGSHRCSYCLSQITFNKSS